MRPAQRLDDHVNGGGQVVATIRVTLFVRQNTLELRGGEALLNVAGYQHDRTDDPEHARLPASGGARMTRSSSLLNRGAFIALTDCAAI